MSKTPIAAATLAVAFLSSAGAAGAASIIINTPSSGLNAPAGQQMIEDFDNPIAAGFTFTQVTGAYVRSGALGLDSGVSAPPPNDLTNYETVLGGGQAVLSSSKLMSSFSLYLGSPDSYNAIEFKGPNGYDVLLSGSNLFSPPQAFGGNQAVGLRVNYRFGGALVNQVIFTSGNNSFEFDNLAASVPEPASWAMLIAGFSGLGALLRGQRRTAAALA